VDTTLKTIPVTKLDAARRQLESAIRLYFNYGDEVSIHTLTAAAHGVLTDLAEHRAAGAITLRQALVELFAPEDRKKVHEKLNEAQNFLKHANRDPEVVLEFLPAQTEFLLFDACNAYQVLTGEMTPAFKVYKVWWLLVPGEPLKLDAATEALKREGARLFPIHERVAFFRDAIAAAHSL
jgi:hypothetical protein